MEIFVSAPRVVLSDGLVMEILSWLPVKSLVRFMCVSKPFQFSIISDPGFVKLHLQRSPKATNILLGYSKDVTNLKHSLHSIPLHSFLESPSSLAAACDLSPRFDLMQRFKEAYVVGSCNGLICFNRNNGMDRRLNNDLKIVHTFYLWNPATRKTTSSQDPQSTLLMPASNFAGVIGFGYDNLSDSYKLVFVDLPNDSLGAFETRVCSISDRSSNNNNWRKIQSFPGEPITRHGMYHGTYLDGTLNWITHEARHSDKLLIISLDLGKESYTRLLLPSGLHGLLPGDFSYACIHQYKFLRKPLSIGVLKDFLSLFFHNPRTNLFALWQMKEFGNQNSWTLLHNITSQNLQIDSKLPYYFLKPLYIFENGNVLIIHKTYGAKENFRAIFYSGRDKMVKHTELSGNILYVFFFDHVQSLVWPRKY